MTSPERIPFELIRERAYDLWERNHRPAGMEIEFWVMAERELRTERERAAAKLSDQPSDQPSRGDA